MAKEQKTKGNRMLNEEPQAQEAPKWMAFQICRGPGTPASGQSEAANILVFDPADGMSAALIRPGALSIIPFSSPNHGDSP